MWLSLSAVQIKLFLEKFINSLVDVKGRAARPGDFMPDIQPKTTRALHEKFDFTAADFVGTFLARFVRLAPLPHIAHSLTL